MASARTASGHLFSSWGSSDMSLPKLTADQIEQVETIRRLYGPIESLIETIEEMAPAHIPPYALGGDNPEYDRVLGALYDTTSAQMVLVDTMMQRLIPLWPNLSASDRAHLDSMTEDD